jgi:hypothetical protein
VSVLDTDYKRRSQYAATVTEESFRQFLRQVEEATNRVLNGDATLWKQLCSHREDATIYGGWDGFEKAWKLS